MYEKCKNISVPTSIAAQVKNLQVRIRYVNVQFSQKLYGNKIHRGVFLHGRFDNFKSPEIHTYVMKENEIV